MKLLTDKETDKRRLKHNLPGGGIWFSRVENLCPGISGVLHAVLLRLIERKGAWTRLLGFIRRVSFLM